MGAPVPADDLPGGSRAVPADDLPGTTAGNQQDTMTGGERAAEDVTNVGTGLVSGTIAPARAARGVGKALQNQSPLAEAATSLIPGAAALRGATGLQDILLGNPEIAKMTGQVEQFADRPSKTPEGRYIKSVAEQVPGALIGPGALPFKAASAVGGGVLGQGAADVTGGNPYARAIGSLVGNLGGSYLAGKVVPGLSTERPLTAQEQSDTELMDAGYNLTPSQARPTQINKLIEGVGGKYRGSQERSVINQDVTNNLVRQEFGIPDDVPLTEETFKAIRKQAGQAYQGIRDIKTPLTTTPEYSDTIESLVADRPELAKSIDDLRIDAGQGGMSLTDSGKPELLPNKAVSRINQLREEGYDDLKSLAATSETKSLARAKIKVASALEKLIEDNFESIYPDRVQAMRNARTLIAKAHDAEAALTPNFDIAEKAMAKVGQKSPLSGNLKTIATMGGRYPKATQEVSSSGGTPNINPLEVGMALSTGNPVAAGGIPLIGGAARWLQRTPFYQNEFVRPTGVETLPDTGVLPRAVANPGILQLLNQPQDQ